jgi:hydroxymethylbilane synthase
MSRSLRIATRGSRLALWQTEHVAAALARLYPDLETSVVEIRTTGDILTDVPLSSVGSSAFFTREIEAALLAGDVDIAVHSLKDLASQDVVGLRLGAVLEREDARDALLANERNTLETLGRGARVGTSSVRRKALLRSMRPDLELLDLRGNVPTRVRKLDEGGYDAIVLAAAGLNRLGLGHRISEHLDPTSFIPAAGQGAIAVQVRADDSEAAAVVAALQHEATRAAIDAERAFLSELEVGCQAPVGVHARAAGGRLDVRAMVASTDGTERLEVCGTGLPKQAEEIGKRLAAEVRAEGGAELIEAARGAGRPS